MNIAIVGSGISGLFCAWLLHNKHNITVFEAGSYIGGHTNTVAVPSGGRTWNVDTGFIVFNDHNYPNFTRMLNEVGVASRPTEMSFSIRCADRDLEYNGHDLNSLFAQRSNVLKPRFYGMIRDIMRFNKAATKVAEAADPNDTRSLDTFLQEHRLGEWFKRYYLIPMTSAIWSMPAAHMGAFPIRSLAGFMHNHRMLQVEGRPQWRTIVGGSSTYVGQMTAPFRDRIFTHSPVHSIKRLAAGGVQVHTSGDSQHFDAVVLACHADQALKMLAEPSQAESDVLSAIRFTANPTILHSDASLMPKRKRAWAAWNAHVGIDDHQACVSYNMNILQGLQTAEQYLVTLGYHGDIAENSIIRRIDYEHPAFDEAAVAAQQQHHLISGVDRIHYAGAWWGHGFHEDGVRSAIRVCDKLGIQW